MQDLSPALKAAIAPLLNAGRDLTEDGIRAALQAVAPDALFRMCHPFGDLNGADAFCDAVYVPLLQAMPDVERRDMLVMAGRTPEGQDWVGCMGSYMGTFRAPFLDIPATGHLAHMRYHEFYRLEDGKVVEMQAVWDIPELMVQANAWPLAPQLGAYLNTPGPMTCDGLTVSGDGSKAMKHVQDMLNDLCKFPGNPDPAIMRMDAYWHPRMNWYGPTGIGTNRGISGFRNWHQGPFLRGMPDRKLDDAADLMSHWFAEGEYACETGWPNMRLTLSGDGWLGLPPTGTPITLRSLDFWRLEDGLIRENWVLVDLLDAYSQLGLDVFARLKEFNKARVSGTVAPLDWKNA